MIEVPLLCTGRTHQMRNISFKMEQPGDSVIWSRNISARKMKDNTHQYRMVVKALGPNITQHINYKYK